MSAVAISFSMRARSFGSERSAVTLFLLRLNSGKKPAPEPISRRVLSPPGGSTLITSAPRSPKIMPQVGPITMWVNSTTRMPDSGRRGARGDFFRAARALGAAGRFALMGMRVLLLPRPLFRLCLALGPAAQARGVEADIHDIRVEIGRARRREGQILFDMNERHAGLSWRDGDRELVELAEDGLRARPFLHHRHSQWHIDL